MSKYVVYQLDGDPELVCIAVCPNNTDMGTALISIVGVGLPFWAFETLDAGIVTADVKGANFEGAPLCESDAQENRETVAGLYASPPETGLPDGVVWAVE